MAKNSFRFGISDLNYIKPYLICLIYLTVFYLFPFFSLAPAKKETDLEKLKAAEEKILESVAAQTALMGASEIARGVQYTESIRTSFVQRF